MRVNLLLMILGVYISAQLASMEQSIVLVSISSFVPLVIGLLAKRSQNILLLLARLRVILSSVKLDISMKQKFQSSDEVSRKYIEEIIKRELIQKGYTVGTTNNRLRIQDYSDDDRVNGSLQVYFSCQDEFVYLRITNEYPSIVYRDIQKSIRGLESILSDMEVIMRRKLNCDLKHTNYRSELGLDSSVFKDVYLSHFAKRKIKQIEFSEKNHRVVLTDDSLIINASDINTLIDQTTKFSGISKDYS